MREQLFGFRKKMLEHGIDMYMLGMDDDHQSEYVGDHYRAIAEISGFTGSAGTLVIGMDEARLWTDGRYFVQAAAQLKDSGIELMKAGEPGVQGVQDYIAENMQAGQTLGFNGYCTDCVTAEKLEGRLSKKGVRLSPEYDIAAEIWQERPAKRLTPCWILGEAFTGKSAAEKIADFRHKMSEKGAGAAVVAALDDIAWLLNLRADDIPNNPVFLAFMLIEADRIRLYTEPEHFAQIPEACRGGICSIEGSPEIPDDQINAGKPEIFDNKKNAGSCGISGIPGISEASGDAVRAYLGFLGVEIIPEPDRIYTDLEKLDCGPVLLEKERTNYMLRCSLPKDISVVDAELPSKTAKCYKNAMEMANIHKAAVKDGAALTHYMYWFKTAVERTAAERKNAGGSSIGFAAERENAGGSIGFAAENGNGGAVEISGSSRSIDVSDDVLRDEKGERITEWSSLLKLHEFRMKAEGFIEESFDTISAYGANAAMCHYSPSEAEHSEIHAHGLYLVDSGGQYREGTTDVTRTWSCGSLTADEKLSFTLALIGNLRLASQHFPDGTSGKTLDLAARKPFWDRGFDYNHGTGHGVGFCLNVHEGPARIGFRAGGGRYPEFAMHEGVYISDEPGHYVEGSHGVRIENMLLCVKSDRYERFLMFRPETFCPIDKSCIDYSVMTEEDMRLLDIYHANVLRELEPYFTGEELCWLRKCCAPISGN